MAKKKVDKLDPKHVLKSRYVVRYHDDNEPISAWGSVVDAIWTMGVYVRMDKVNDLYNPEYYEVYDSKLDKVVKVSE